jgi:hypothetical protein
VGGYYRHAYEAGRDDSRSGALGNEVFAVMAASLCNHAAGIHIGSTQVFPNKIHASAVYTLKI